MLRYVSFYVQTSAYRLSLSSPRQGSAVPNRLRGSLSTDWNTNPFIRQPHRLPHALPKPLHLIPTRPEPHFVRTGAVGFVCRTNRTFLCPTLICLLVAYLPNSSRGKTTQTGLRRKGGVSFRNLFSTPLSFSFPPLRKKRTQTGKKGIIQEPTEPTTEHWRLIQTRCWQQAQRGNALPAPEGNKEAANLILNTITIFKGSPNTR